MGTLRDLSGQELRAYRAELTSRLEKIKAGKPNIDMTRGKPCPEQLDLSLGILTAADAGHYRAADGTDCRNYGGLEGLPEARRLFGEYLGVGPDEIIIAGNASLTLMHDALMRAMLFGVSEGEPAWGRLSEVKFLAPSPGYDRHFSICEHLGIRMIPIDMDENGPDMDAVERLAAEDGGVKGIWCVPRYSNPTGVTYSGEVVERLAAMPARAADFRIFWDDSYAVHHLTDHPKPLRNILAECKSAGNPDRVLLFGSTSKVSFAGAGLALMGGSRKNIEFTVKHLFYQTIGPDKLNQLRHVLFFKDMAGIEAHMKKHAAMIRPKFEAVNEILARELGEKGVAEWSHPQGGYFISLDTPDGCATQAVRMAAEAGVKFTDAGATFPYKKDPRGRNIRIAPTFPSLGEIRLAMEVLAVCIQLASLEKQG